MRAKAVRDAIITAIQAITPDTLASGSDRLRVVDLGGKDPSGLRERLFTVLLAEVRPTVTIEPSDQQVVYDVAVYYAQHRDTDDRISDDAERVTSALYSLHTQDADIYGAEVSPTRVVTSSSVPQMLEAVTTVTVTYRRTL